MKSGSKMWERKVKGTGEPREAWERGRVRSDLPLRKIKGRGPGKPSLEAGPGGRRPRTQRRLPQDLPAPGRGQEGEREPVPGSQKPAAKEPGEAGAIFSSRSSGRLIAAAASRQAAMETLNATAGSLGLSQSARPAPRPRARTLRGRGRGGARVPPAPRPAVRPGGDSAPRWAFMDVDVIVGAGGWAPGSSPCGASRRTATSGLFQPFLGSWFLIFKTSRTPVYRGVLGCLSSKPSAWLQ